MSPTNREKLHRRTFQLQSAISQISSVRKILCKNSQEIKCQIQGNISRQLEALRNREVWLLNQVDLLQSAKEDVLRNQQARLDTALGSARKTLQILGDASYDIDDLDECVDVEELKPEETPHLMFHVNSVGLREKILKYGKIETVGFPDKSIFTGKHESASLPKAFEDDEDDEHHMLSKTVSRGPGSVSLPGSFRRHLPGTPQTRPTTPQTRTATPQTRPATSQTRPATPTSWLKQAPKTAAVLPVSRTTTDLSEWLKPRDLPVDLPRTGIQHVSSDASICSWLHNLKTSPHMEDDEFELIDAMMATSNKDAESYGYQPAQAMPVPKRKPTRTNVFFKQLQSQAVKLWVNTKQTGHAAERKPTSPPVKRDSLAATTRYTDFARYYDAVSAQNSALWLLKSPVRTNVPPGDDSTARKVPVEPAAQDAVQTSANSVRTSTAKAVQDVAKTAHPGEFDASVSSWIRRESPVKRISRRGITFQQIQLFRKDQNWLQILDVASDNSGKNDKSEEGMDVGCDCERTGSSEVSSADHGFSDVMSDCGSSSVDVLLRTSSYDEWLRLPVREEVRMLTPVGRNNFSVVSDNEIHLWLLKP